MYINYLLTFKINMCTKYPDFTEGFCRSDGLHELKPFVFTTAEHCCNNALMNYASCVVESIQRFQEAPPTTPSPTHKPTPLPPAPPGNYVSVFLTIPLSIKLFTNLERSICHSILTSLQDFAGQMVIIKTSRLCSRQLRNAVTMML